MTAFKDFFGKKDLDFISKRSTALLIEIKEFTNKKTENFGISVESFDGNNKQMIHKFAQSSLIETSKQKQRKVLEPWLLAQLDLDLEEAVKLIKDIQALKLLVLEKDNKKKRLEAQNRLESIAMLRSRD